MNARTAAARHRARVTRAPRPERQSGGRECVRCLNPLPDGATMRRLFCSDACRVYAARDRSVTTRGLWGQAASVETEAPHSGATSTVTAAPRPENGAPAAIAAAIPTPADEYGPARAYCEVRGGGYGVVFGRGGGRGHEPAGPVFPRPRQAIALADLLNGRLLAG